MQKRCQRFARIHRHHPQSRKRAAGTGHSLRGRVLAFAARFRSGLQFGREPRGL